MAQTTRNDLESIEVSHLIAREALGVPGLLGVRFVQRGRRQAKILVLTDADAAHVHLITGAYLAERAAADLKIAHDDPKEERA